MKITKKQFKKLVHFIYVTSIFYALYFFFTTPRRLDMFHRRLWAYEFWLILSFYCLFLWIFHYTDPKDLKKFRVKLFPKLRENISSRRNSDNNSRSEDSEE